MENGAPRPEKRSTESPVSLEDCPDPSRGAATRRQATTTKAESRGRMATGLPPGVAPACPERDRPLDLELPRGVAETLGDAVQVGTPGRDPRHRTFDLLSRCGGLGRRARIGGGDVLQGPHRAPGHAVR